MSQSRNTAWAGQLRAGGEAWTSERQRFDRDAPRKPSPDGSEKRAWSVRGDNVAIAATTAFVSSTQAFVNWQSGAHGCLA